MHLDDVLDRVTLALESYSIVRAARQLEEFAEDLTNWYIRRSRDRFWSSPGEKSSAKEAGYQTLYEVLTTLSKLIAPFTPFLAELLHEHLVRSVTPGAPVSVHLEAWPEGPGVMSELAREKKNDLLLLAGAMGLAKRIVGLGRAARSSHDLRTRQPLASATLVFAPEASGVDLREQVARVREVILDELNVKAIAWAERRGDFVRHEVRPNFRLLGKRLGGRMKAVQAALAAADGDALSEALEQTGALTLEADGEAIALGPEEVEVRLIEKEGLATAGDRELLVVLDTRLTPELVAEGRAREIVNRIQGARKELGLDYAERIRVRYAAAPELEAAIETWRPWIAGETLAVELAPGSGDLKPAPVDELDFAFVISTAS